jgi:hypothetical protein
MGCAADQDHTSPDVSSSNHAPATQGYFCRFLRVSGMGEDVVHPFRERCPHVVKGMSQGRCSGQECCEQDNLPDHRAARWWARLGGPRRCAII